MRHTERRKPPFAAGFAAAAGLVLALGAPLPAQSASYSYIDQRAPYQNWGTTGLKALSLPRIGTTFQLSVPMGTVWSHGTHFVLATGATNPDVAVPALGGFLFTSAEHVVPTPWGWGWGMTTLSFPIPNAPSLVGVSFYQQVLALTSCGIGSGSCPPPTLSRGGHGVIGQ